MTERGQRRLTLLSAGLLFSGFFYYITFVQFGLLNLARARLHLEPAQMPVAMGLMTAGGFAASVWVGRWLEGAGAPLRARIRLIAGCSAAQAVLAFATLALAQPAHVTVLCAVLGLLLGANSVATLSLVFDGLPAASRWMICGGIVAVIYLGANIPPLVFDRPERIISANALLMMLTAVGAWTQRGVSPHAGADAPDAHAPPDESFARWLPFVLLVVLLDSYTFQRLLTTPALWALTWGSTAHIWTNGIVHAAGAIAVGWMATRRRSGARWIGVVAALSLVATETLLLSGGAGVAGGYVLTVVYNVGVSAYFVMLLGLWPVCLGPRPGRRLGWGVAAVCWFAAPTGIGLATQATATRVAAYAPALACSVLALWWIYPRNAAPSVRHAP